MEAAQQTKALQIDPVLRLPQVEAAIGQGKSQVYRLVKAGLLPQPLKLGKRASGWRSSDIAAYIARLTPAAQASKEVRGG